MKRILVMTLIALNPCAWARAEQGAAPNTGCSPSAAELKKLAVDAQLVGRDDANAVIRLLDKSVGVDTAYVTMHPAISLSSRDDLSAHVVLPYPLFRRGVAEALRKRELIEAVPVPAGVTISIGPTRLDSPDIVKVIVTRDGVEVAPIASSLKPTELTTRLGAKAILHAGELLYPCKAFEAGGDVTVLLIPETGSNIETQIRRSELALFSTKAVDIIAKSLVNLKAADVEARIGKPSRVDGHRWTYDTTREKLMVYFNDADVVVDVQPPTFDLTVFRRTP